MVAIMSSAMMNAWGKHLAFGAFSSEAGKSNLSLTKSFKDVLVDKFSDLEPYVKLIRTTYKGVPLLMCSDIKIEKLLEPLTFSLIKKFSFNHQHIFSFFGTF